MGASFQDNLADGQLGESIIGRYLRSRGNCVLPVYEKEIDTGKGPRLFIPDAELVAPDMFILPKMLWVEAKHKSVFSWHRKSKSWCTGIDLRHYEDYRKVQEITDVRVWLFFLHKEGTPSKSDLGFGCPPECPTGLFAEKLEYLIEHENHRSDKWGNSGMVYWAFSTLKRLEYLEDMGKFAND